VRHSPLVLAFEEVHLSRKMGCTQSAVSEQFGRHDVWSASDKVEVPKSAKLAVKTHLGKSFYDHYLLGTTLGRGSFGQVRVAHSIESSQDVVPVSHAVKIIDMRQPQQPISSVDVDGRAFVGAKWEAAVWRKASEASVPNCVRLHEVFWEGSTCFMVMERCDMTLRQAFERSTEVTEPILRSNFHQMVAAVAGLHAVRIAHRDIKPENFLVNRGWRLKLADFGFATILMNGIPMTDLYGTAPFMSPEMLLDGTYDEKTDIWSLGVMMYVLTYGHLPYTPEIRSVADMKKAIAVANTTPSFRPAVRGAPLPSRPLEVLIRTVLERAPQARPAGKEIMKDEYWQRQTGDSCEHGQAAPDFGPCILNAIRQGALGGNERNTQEGLSPIGHLLAQNGIVAAVKPHPNLAGHPGLTHTRSSSKTAERCTLASTSSPMRRTHGCRSNGVCRERPSGYGSGKDVYDSSSSLGASTSTSTATGYTTGSTFMSSVEEQQAKESSGLETFLDADSDMEEDAILVV